MLAVSVGRLRVDGSMWEVSPIAELPDDDELLAAVRDAGWLLEHHAVRVLDAAEMHPRAGWAYKDPDEPTISRELDVWSYRQLLKDESAMVYVTARFLVECKQSALPFVGIGYELPEWRFSENPTQHLLPCKQVRAANPDLRFAVNRKAWYALGFRQLAQEHGETNFRVTQLSRLDRARGGKWTATNSGIFTSLVYPLAKALRASQGGSSPRTHMSPSLPQAAPRDEWLDFGLHFPVVLVSCPLYVVDATDSEPKVEQRPWFTAQRELKSASTAGTFEIDVVTESAFADYVANRLAFASSLAALVGTNPLRFTDEDKPPMSQA